MIYFKYVNFNYKTNEQHEISLFQFMPLNVHLSKNWYYCRVGYSESLFFPCSPHLGTLFSLLFLVVCRIFDVIRYYFSIILKNTFLYCCGNFFISCLMYGKYNSYIPFFWYPCGLHYLCQ